MKVSASVLGHSDTDNGASLAPKLQEFRISVLSLSKDKGAAADDLVGIIRSLEYRFSGDEQIDLYDWIPILDFLDTVLRELVESNASNLLMVGGRNIFGSKWDLDFSVDNTESEATTDLEAIEGSLKIILEFLAEFLQSSVNKHVFNSAEVLLVLLCAKSETLHSVALDAIYGLVFTTASTDLSHALGHPSTHQQLNPTQLHTLASENSVVSETIVELSRGWGGLFDEVSVDDAGQRMGFLKRIKPDGVTLEYWSDQNDEQGSSSNNCVAETHHAKSSLLEPSSPKFIKFNISTNEINDLPKKVRSSTSALFSHCMALLERQYPEHNIPFLKRVKLFHSIRLTLASTLHETRTSAIERSLKALTIAIITNPSQDVLSGLFAAQPELVGELVRLIKVKFDGESGTCESNLQSLATSLSSQGIRCSVRTVVINVFASLITRKEQVHPGSSSSLSTIAKQTNALSELGVGKGRYLGLLPSMIRFSLSSLTSSNSRTKRSHVQENKGISAEESEEDDDCFRIGMAFLKATRFPTIPYEKAEHQVLEFLRALLNLTVTVVNIPSGSSALTDCGLIPAIMNVINHYGLESEEEEIIDHYTLTLRRGIVSQSVQILDTAIVSHTGAYTVFSECDGVNVLISRTHYELKRVVKQIPTRAKADSSVRVLLYNLLMCLTVVFQQEENSSSSTSNSSSGKFLRSPELTECIKLLLQSHSWFGDILLALVSTMLSEVLNADPQCVHHVHESGIALAYLHTVGDELSAIPDLLMVIPNVLSALALTEQGSKVVRNFNPFPKLVKIFYTSKFCMPTSKCLLNDITPIVGTSFDELLRHTPLLRPLCVESLVGAMKDIVNIGEGLVRKEAAVSCGQEEKQLYVRERTHFMQYAFNICHLISHVFHTTEHVTPFVEAGGWEYLLKLHPLLICADEDQLLAHITSLSNLNLAHLSHFGASSALTIIAKNIIGHHDPQKVLSSTLTALDEAMEGVASDLEQVRKNSVDRCENDPMDTDAVSKCSALSFRGFLSKIPREPLHRLDSSPGYLVPTLRKIIHIEWLMQIFSFVLRSASTRNRETMGWGTSNHQQWKKELSGLQFQRVLDRLTEMYTSSQWEVCHIRTECGYEVRENERRKQEHSEDRSGVYWHPLTFKLRIVCQDGAIVRDGIEIDACHSVGSLEMGEIVLATDRCINTCGVMRYKIHNGWISELTRGHGREPIAEVIEIRGTRTSSSPIDQRDDKGFKRVNLGVIDICSASTSVVARLQGAYRDIFAALSKSLTQGIPRTLWGRSPDNISIDSHNLSICKMITENLKVCFAHKNRSGEDVKSRNALYLAGVIDIVFNSLYEERRERKHLNMFLLAGLLNSDGLLKGRGEDIEVSSVSLPSTGFLGAIREILIHTLENFSKHGKIIDKNFRIDRSVAASISSALFLLNKLTDRSLLTNTNMKGLLQKLGAPDFISNSTPDFVRHLHCILGDICIEVFKDDRLVCLPAHILNGFLRFVDDTLSCLREAKSRDQSSTSRGDSANDDTTTNLSANGSENGANVRGISVSDLHRRLEMGMNSLPRAMNLFLNGQSRSDGVFEASEESINRLIDMGFGRDHALEALEQTGSNRVEVAMEYALTHPPPSPTTVERRRAQRGLRAAAQLRANAANQELTSSSSRRQISTNIVGNETGYSLPRRNVDGDELSSNADTGEHLKSVDERKKEDLREDILVNYAKNLHDILYSHITPMSLSIAEGNSGQFSRNQEDFNCSGQKEGEDVVAVVATFVLNLLSKFYSKDLAHFVWKLLDRIHSHISNNLVLAYHEMHLASLCHFALITLRALPRLRVLVLRKNLCSTLIKTVKYHCEKKELFDEKPWISGALLLLDLVAQPTTSPMEDVIKIDGVEFKDDGRKGEYQRNCGDHKRQAALLSKCASDMCTIVFNAKVKARSNAKKVKKKCESQSSQLPTIPSFTSILPSDEADGCIQLCYKMLSLVKDVHPSDKIAKNPGIVQSILLLISRLVRSHKVALKFLRMGGIELILSLPPSCNFIGKAGTITTIMRHVLEDDNTLRQSMEAEIRSTVMRLHKKQWRRTSSSQDDLIKVNAVSFAQTIAPLICRNPIVFLKAAATSIATEPSDGLEGSSIVLLSSEERSETTKALSGYFGSGNTVTLQHSNEKSHDGSLSVRSGVPKRKHFTKVPIPLSKGKKKKSGPKSPKKMKKLVRSDSIGKRANFIFLNGTPANHVTSLLVSNLISVAEIELKMDFRTDPSVSSFITLTEYIDIIADLVLAIPVCAAVIHRYRPINGTPACSRLSNLKHALGGCTSPPGTAVGYLLHYLLPINRSLPRKEVLMAKDNKPALFALKRRAYFGVQAVQKASRLLVILCARAGEGRRRVVGDLASALAGCVDGHTRIKLPPCQTERELWALRSWAELCIGLSAPRSSGINQDTNSSLSWEVVRLMLEFKVPQALLSGIRRVDLNMTLASTTICSLLRPLEVFTRATVTDTVEEMVRVQVEKEEAHRATNERKERSRDLKRRITVGPSQRAENAFADDAMLGDGFMPEDADRARRSAQRRDLQEMVGNICDEISFDDDEDESESEGSDVEEMSVDTNESSSDEIEVRLGNPDDSSSDDSDHGDSVDGFDSSDDPSEIEVIHADDDMIEVDHNEQDVDDFEEDDDGEEAWEHDEDEAFFDGNFEDREGVIGLPSESELDEGWTRIDHLGGHVRNGTLFIRSQSNEPLRDDTDSIGVLGQIMNGGFHNVHFEALAEIQETLGIRLRGRNNRRDAAGADDDDPGSIGGLLGGLINVVGGTNSNNTNSSQPAPRELGSRPSVSQNSYCMQTISSGGFSRGRCHSPIDIVFGGLSDFLSAQTDASRQQAGCNRLSESIPLSYETQLFPLGPAAATHSRTHQFLHPLLCDVILPPTTTLTSSAESHGVRSLASRRNIPLSSQNDNSRHSNLTVRLNRGLDGIPVIEHSVGSGGRTSSNITDSRWTGDGQPLDRFMLNFSQAFEQALTENMAMNISEQERLHGQTNESLTNSTFTSEGPSGADRGSGDLVPDQLPVADELNRNEQQTDRSDGSCVHNEEVPSEGEAVATSLATGLSLACDGSMNSSADECENNHGPNGNNETQVNNQENEGNHLGTLETSDASPSMEVVEEQVQQESASNEELPSNSTAVHSQPNEDGLVCPPGMDFEVFNCLPPEMQQEVVEEHRSMESITAQIDSTSGLDPEALAALPDDMRREIIAQQQQQSQRNEPPADPSNAEDMDNASFLASLHPELRSEILLSADNDFLSSLPPNIVAEAQVIRERAASRAHHRVSQESLSGPVRQSSSSLTARNQQNNQARSSNLGSSRNTANSYVARRSRQERNRFGQIKLDRDREKVIFSGLGRSDNPFASSESMISLLNLFFMLNSVRPMRLFQNLLMNIGAHAEIRHILLTTMLSLLQGDTKTAKSFVMALNNEGIEIDRNCDFPPSSLIGTSPDIVGSEVPNTTMFRRRNANTAALSIAANIPATERRCVDGTLPPIVSRRIIETLCIMAKKAPIVSLEVLENKSFSHLNCVIDLLRLPHFTKSPTNLEQLLNLLELVVSPLAVLPKLGEDEAKLSLKEKESAAAAGKEWIRVPRPLIDQGRVKLLCSILRLESCKDVSFQKVSHIVRRLCRIEDNRLSVLTELAFVAQGLGVDAMGDLKSLNINLDEAAKSQKELNVCSTDNAQEEKKEGFMPASAVTLSSSSSELKLLRVLQTIQSLCDDEDGSRRSEKQNDANSIKAASLLRTIDLEGLWEELSTCLKVVSVIQGVALDEDDEDREDEDMTDQDVAGDNEVKENSKKLPSSAAGLLTRFLPAIEAFFIVNASRSPHGTEKLVKFVAANKILLSALLRANPPLLEKGLKAMVLVSECRPFIDFDVKRHWFKTQVRRLKQSASRRSLRLNIRRKNVFEDAYASLRLRTAEEMRGRLHITFVEEEGVDAGGLSREFFEILAKEMFNPNYALFTSTEDGCTFQPNPNSSFVNPDHLDYFRFVGRIVGKALADGFLLDAHFTRSLYKHMLGIKPTHHDMEAIDPDYYKNLTTILKYNLEDIGLDHLTFSTEDHSFGRSKTIDLIPNGRSVSVTENNKEKYVSLICQHRMTTSIEPQTKAYLQGFHEMIKKDLISIFNAKELELLISGLPDIDIHDLQSNTEYTNYKVSDPQIIWFWEAMHGLTRSQKASFLQFVTGSAKVPLEGFSQLQGMRGTQKFSIHKASGSSESLISAHTCFNALDLPMYDSKEILREKLLYAIAEGQGSFQFA